VSQPSVLVVDDEPAIRRLLRTSLAAQSWQVTEATGGAEALAAVARGGIDVVLLDLGLPDTDGLDVIRALRAKGSSLPIVVLTVRDAEREKVLALDLGADDYVTKPFGMAELVARLRAALRHALQQQGTPAAFASGNLTVDLVRRVVTVGGAEVRLSPREWDILHLLVSHAGRVLTHRTILGRLWGAGGDVQQLRVYIRQLRQKLEADPEQPRHIVTETGVGYRLIVQDDLAGARA
jgi:two-component system KDP operon response regulator KdpE